MKKSVLIFVMILVLFTAWANEGSAVTVSSTIKLQTPIGYALADELKPLNPAFGATLDLRYGFLSADTTFVWGKDESGNVGCFPYIATGITLPVKNFRFSFGRGYAFKEEKNYIKSGFAYVFKNGVTLGVEVENPNDFSFKKKNWTEMNHLRKTVLNSKVTIQAGIKLQKFSEHTSEKTNFLKPSDDWYLRASQGFAFSGIGLINQKDRWGVSVEASSPIFAGLITYADFDKRAYKYQIIDAAFFTSVKFETAVSYDFLKNNEDVNLAASAKITSLWFNGQYIQVPAYFQSYSFNLGLICKFWLNSNNGIFVEADVPCMTLYFNDGEAKPRFKTIFTDNNTFTVIKYMAKVVYVHKI